MQTLNELQIEYLEEDLDDLLQIIDNTNDYDEIKYLTKKKEILIKELNDLELTRKYESHTSKVHSNSYSRDYS